MSIEPVLEKITKQKGCMSHYVDIRHCAASWQKHCFQKVNLIVINYYCWHPTI